MNSRISDDKGYGKVDGIFITIEGPDGAGKTSVLKELLPLLEATVQMDVIATREPGGSRIAEEIRELILNPVNTEMDIRTEALLYAAARRQHLIEKINPALESGALLMCDRFVDSSLAYQGAGRDIGVEAVREMNLFATEGLEPDLTLYLDVEASVGIERITRNKDSRQFDRLDQEKIEFHEKVRTAYLKLASENPKRIKMIDASGSISEVVAACYTLITEKLKLKEVE